MKFFNVLMVLAMCVAMPAVAEEIDCSESVLLVFFPKDFVKKTLSENQIPKDQIDKIADELANADGKIKQIIDDKASKMNPNPFTDKGQRDKAMQIFTDTLSQVFSDTMKANGVTDDQKIQAMLTDIQTQRMKRFEACMPKLQRAKPNLPQ